jgi:hypothetical protein
MTKDKQQTDLTRQAKKAIARSRDLLERTKALQEMRTSEERAADSFAAKAVEAVLTPAPDGLEVLEELARPIKIPR